MPPEPGFIAADWPAPPWIKAGTTTRGDGVDDRGFAGANLADHVGDDPAAVAENRARITGLLGLPSAPCWMAQQHGRRVVEASGDRQAADACLTRRRGVVCAVLGADCLPLLLCAPGDAVVAAVHVGWRGLCAGVIEATLAAMEPARDGLMAWLGPAICQRHYQVGADVRRALLERRAGLSVALAPDPPHHWRLDLTGAAALVLRDAGVEAITDSGLCTYADRRFYSHRRAQPTGRTASLIWMQAA